MRNRETRRTRGMTTALGAVNGFLQSHELAQVLRQHRAKVIWAELVGPQIANVTQVERVTEGVLYVKVEAGPWAHEMMWIKDDIVRRLNLALGGRVLTDIHVYGGDVNKSEKKPVIISAPTPTEAELARIVLSEEVRARVEEALIGITDEALRGRIRAVMLHAARTDEWKRLRGWTSCPRCGALAPPAASSGTAPAEAEAAPLCDLCRAGIR